MVVSSTVWVGVSVQGSRSTCSHTGSDAVCPLLPVQVQADIGENDRYIGVCGCGSRSVHVCACVYVCMHVEIWRSIFAHSNTHVIPYNRMRTQYANHVKFFAYEGVRVVTTIQSLKHTPIHPHTYTHTHMHRPTPAYTHTHIHTYTHTHIHPHTHTDTHTQYTHAQYTHAHRIGTPMVPLARAMLPPPLARTC